MCCWNKWTLLDLSRIRLTRPWRASEIFLLFSLLFSLFLWTSRAVWSDNMTHYRLAARCYRCLASHRAEFFWATGLGALRASSVWGVGQWLRLIYDIQLIYIIIQVAKREEVATLALALFLCLSNPFLDFSLICLEPELSLNFFLPRGSALVVWIEAWWFWASFLASIPSGWLINRLEICKFSDNCLCTASAMSRAHYCQQMKHKGKNQACEMHMIILWYLSENNFCQFNYISKQKKIVIYSYLTVIP